ncbi:hypothetical protein BaRGS_00004567 [Batillaria attramentaria]|uniref:Uncharacterized protein n=1 Tax=Batillaria attramentaria TaxID=370345 RepID=A0ABD0LXT5_9CAEN
MICYRQHVLSTGSPFLSPRKGERDDVNEQQKSTNFSTHPGFRLMTLGGSNYYLMSRRTEYWGLSLHDVTDSLEHLVAICQARLGCSRLALQSHLFVDHRDVSAAQLESAHTSNSHWWKPWAVDNAKPLLASLGGPWCEIDCRRYWRSHCLDLDCMVAISGDQWVHPIRTGLRANWPRGEKSDKGSCGRDRALIDSSQIYGLRYFVQLPYLPAQHLYHTLISTLLKPHQSRRDPLLFLEATVPGGLLTSPPSSEEFLCKGALPRLRAAGFFNHEATHPLSRPLIQPDKLTNRRQASRFTNRTSHDDD